MNLSGAHSALVAAALLLSGERVHASRVRGAVVESGEVSGIVPDIDSFDISPELAQDMLPQSREGGSEESSRRKLQSSVDFVPLACNSNMPASCNDWSYAMANYTSPDYVTTIPCGQCVDVDVTDGSTVSLNGLDVVGELYFYDTARITIETPYIYVQGKLSIDQEAGPVTGTPNVKFTMTGDSTNKFVPAEENSSQCPTGGCDVGQKAIIVAGGTLDINAMDSDCPTWSYVQDFSSGGVTSPHSNYPSLQQPLVSAGCSNDILDVSFDDPSLGYNGGLDGWYGNLGAEEVIESGSHDGTSYLRIHKRTAAFQGPLLNLHRRTHVPCIKADTNYFFSAMIRLDPGNATTSPSQCSTTGTQCPKLRYSYMNSTDHVKWRDLALMTDSQLAQGYPQDGTWFQMTGMVEMMAEWVDPSNVFSVVTINGPELEIDISVDNIRWGLPPANAYVDPDDTCTELLLNGGGRSDPRLHISALLLPQAGRRLQALPQG